MCLCKSWIAQCPITSRYQQSTRMLTMRVFCQDCSSVLRQAVESLNESALLLPLQLQHDVLLANVPPAGKIPCPAKSCKVTIL